MGLTWSTEFQDGQGYKEKPCLEKKGNGGSGRVGVSWRCGPVVEHLFLTMNVSSVLCCFAFMGAHPPFLSLRLIPLGLRKSLHRVASLPLTGARSDTSFPGRHRPLFSHFM